MPFYKYKYIKEEKEYEETKDFADKNSLYNTVRSNNATIVSVEEIKNKKNIIKFFSFRKKIKSQEIITFAKNLAVMIDAGLSVSRALAVL